MSTYIAAYCAFLVASGAAVLTVKLRRSQLQRLDRDFDLDTITEEQLVAWLGTQ